MYPRLLASAIVAIVEGTVVPVVAVIDVAIIERQVIVIVRAAISGIAIAGVGAVIALIGIIRLIAIRLIVGLVVALIIGRVVVWIVGRHRRNGPAIGIRIIILRAGWGCRQRACHTEG